MLLPQLLSPGTNQKPRTSSRNTTRSNSESPSRKKHTATARTTTTPAAASPKPTEQTTSSSAIANLTDISDRNRLQMRHLHDQVGEKSRVNVIERRRDGAGAELNQIYKSVLSSYKDDPALLSLRSGKGVPSILVPNLDDVMRALSDERLELKKQKLSEEETMANLARQMQWLIQELGNVKERGEVWEERYNLLLVETAKAVEARSQALSKLQDAEELLRVTNLANQNEAMRNTAIVKELKGQCESLREQLRDEKQLRNASPAGKTPLKAVRSLRRLKSTSSPKSAEAAAAKAESSHEFAKATNLLAKSENQQQRGTNNDIESPILSPTLRPSSPETYDQDSIANTSMPQLPAQDEKTDPTSANSEVAILRRQFSAVAAQKERLEHRLSMLEDLLEKEKESTQLAFTVSQQESKSLKALLNSQAAKVKSAEQNAMDAKVELERQVKVATELQQSLRTSSHRIAELQKLFLSGPSVQQLLLSGVSSNAALDLITQVERLTVKLNEFSSKVCGVEAPPSEDNLRKELQEVRSLIEARARNPQSTFEPTDHAVERGGGKQVRHVATSADSLVKRSSRETQTEQTPFALQATVRPTVQFVHPTTEEFKLASPLSAEVKKATQSLEGPQLLHPPPLSSHLLSDPLPLSTPTGSSCTSPNEEKHTGGAKELLDNVGVGSPVTESPFSPTSPAEEPDSHADPPSSPAVKRKESTKGGSKPRKKSVGSNAKPTQNEAQSPKAEQDEMPSKWKRIASFSGDNDEIVTDSLSKLSQARKKISELEDALLNQTQATERAELMAGELQRSADAVVSKLASIDREMKVASSLLEREKEKADTATASMNTFATQLTATKDEYAAHKVACTKEIDDLKTTQTNLRNQLLKLTQSDQKTRLQSRARELLESCEKTIKCLTSLDSVATCGICLERLENPIVVIPCGHLFCERCFLVKQKDRNIPLPKVTAENLAQPSLPRGVPHISQQPFTRCIADHSFCCPDCDEKFPSGQGYQLLPTVEEIVSHAAYVHNECGDIQDTIKVDLLSELFEQGALQRLLDASDLRVGDKSHATEHSRYVDLERPPTP